MKTPINIPNAKNKNMVTIGPIGKGICQKVKILPAILPIITAFSYQSI